MVHYLERRVVIRAKTNDVEKMFFSTLGLLSTVCGYHMSIGERGHLLLARA